MSVYGNPVVIYLGTKISDEKKLELPEVAKQKKIECYRMVKKAGSYKLILERIF